METEILGNTIIEMDLGVFIDEELKFHANVSKAEEKASHLLGLIYAHSIILMSNQSHK